MFYLSYDIKYSVAVLKKIIYFFYFKRLLREAKLADNIVCCFRNGDLKTKDLGNMTPEERQKYLYNS